MFSKKIMKKNFPRNWNEALLEVAFDALAKEMALPAGVPGGMPQYRLALCLSFFFKFFLEVAEELQLDIAASEDLTPVGHLLPHSLQTTQVYQV